MSTTPTVRVTIATGTLHTQVIIYCGTGVETSNNDRCGCVRGSAGQYAQAAVSGETNVAGVEGDTVREEGILRNGERELIPAQGVGTSAGGNIRVEVPMHAVGGETEAQSGGTGVGITPSTQRTRGTRMLSMHQPPAQRD
eukprot:IDg4093t1